MSDKIQKSMSEIFSSLEDSLTPEALNTDEKIKKGISFDGVLESIDDDEDIRENYTDVEPLLKSFADTSASNNARVARALERMGAFVMKSLQGQALLADTVSDLKDQIEKMGSQEKPKAITSADESSIKKGLVQPHSEKPIETTSEEDVAEEAPEFEYVGQLKPVLKKSLKEAIAENEADGGSAFVLKSLRNDLLTLDQIDSHRKTEELLPFLSKAGRKFV